MRDILIKNLTSYNKRRRIIASSEVSEKEGMRSIIHRHFVCVAKEITDATDVSKPVPYLCVRKEHNTKEHKQRFSCRLKGSILVAAFGKIYLVYYIHSLKINILDLTQNIPL